MGNIKDVILEVRSSNTGGTCEETAENEVYIVCQIRRGIMETKIQCSDHDHVSNDCFWFFIS